MNGQGLLPTIHVYTDAKGRLAWALLGCPCLEHNGYNESVVGDPLFFFYKAPQLVRAVHTVKVAYHLHRDGRALQVAVTVADQVI